MSRCAFISFLIWNINCNTAWRSSVPVGPQQPLALEGNVHIAHEAKPGAKKLTGCYQKVSNKVINVWLLLSYLPWILFSETLKSKSGELGPSAPNKNVSVRAGFKGTSANLFPLKGQRM